MMNITQKVKSEVEKTPLEIRNNVFKARKWAKHTLAQHEGAGHEIAILRDNKKGFVCLLSKPEWAEYHWGTSRYTGALAVVYAVHEYLDGK